MAAFRYVLAFLLFFSIDTALADDDIWQGPYIGAFLGGGFGNSHISSDAGSVTSTSYFANANDLNAVNDAGSWTKNPSTWLFGIQAGHDWTWQQMLYGIVFDYSYFSLNSSKTENNTYSVDSGEYSVHVSARTNWLFTLRGRWGYQTMFELPTLLYLTGGMAMARVKVSNDFNDTSALLGAEESSTSENQIGWTVGLGMEIIPLNHFGIDFEYLYVDIPSVETTGTISNTAGGFGVPVNSLNSSFSSSAKFHANIFKIGINYRFDD